MSHIYNKSQHPVEVKRIPVRIWALRDEIEAAVYRRLQECEVQGCELYLDDIKEFYGMKLEKPLGAQPQLQLVEGVDQMMEALDSANAPTPETAPTEGEPAAQAAETPTETPVEPPVEAAASAEGTASETPSAEKVEAHSVADNSIQAADQIMAQAPATPVKPAFKPTTPVVRQAPDLEKISYGFALMSDINMDWILTFSKQKYTNGQSVVIEFLIPRSFNMEAEILQCTHYAMRSRVISQTKPDFRLQCRFTFSRPGERSSLRDFLKSIEPELPIKRAAKPPQEAGPEA